MSDLKNSWKETGRALGEAFSDLGKTLYRTAKKGLEKVDEWATNDEPAKKENNRKK